MGGILEMEGGEISFNRSKLVGGIRVGLSSNHVGTFTMTGGTIGGNTGGTAGGVHIHLDKRGGGQSPGAFTKTGGTIYGRAGNRLLDNEAVGDTSDKGHAVFWLRDFNSGKGKRLNGDHTDGTLSIVGPEVLPGYYTSDFDWDPEVTGVTVSSPALSAARGDTVQLSATVDWYRGEGQSQEVMWKLNGADSPGTTAGGSSISANGLLSVGANETAPNLTVTAVSVADPRVSGSKDVVVVAAAVGRTVAGLYIGESTEPVDLSGSGYPKDNLLVSAIRYIGSHASTSYTIVLGENISMESTRLTVWWGTVTLEGLGEERIITFKGFTIPAVATLILGNNITLKGVSNNTDALVSVSGNLVMQGNSKITNNVITGNINSQAAGVVITDGNFTMEGNSSIRYNSNNTTSSNGAGGVSLSGGLFTMKDSADISSNTSSASNRSAGGVSLYGSRTTTSTIFMMTGGSISSNTAAGNRSGGGLEIVRGTFIKKGGVISDNTANTSAATGFGHSVYSEQDAAGNESVSKVDRDLGSDSTGDLSNKSGEDGFSNWD
jgi:hypothetical protein